MSRLLSKLGNSGRRHEDEDYDDEAFHETNTGAGTVRAPSRSASRTGHSLQHPIGSYQAEPGSGIVGGTAVENTGLGNAHSTGHTGLGSSSTTGYGGRAGGVNVETRTTTNTKTSHGISTTGGGLTDRTRNDNFSPTTTGTHPGVGHNITNVNDPDHHTAGTSSNPFFGASNNRGAAGDVGSRRDIEERRASQAGIAGTGLHSGPHSHLENRDAVPTAGGNKIGTGAAYDSPSQGVPHQHQQHHYGRDGALAGGAGYGAYDATHNNNTTSGPHNSNMLNKADPRVDSDNSNLHNQNTYGRNQYDNDRFDNNNNRYDNDYDRNNNTTNTSGPHKSNLLNKLDPRVDSDNSKLENQNYNNPSRTASRNQNTNFNNTTHRSNSNQYGTSSSNFGDNTATPLSQSGEFQRRHNSGVMGIPDPNPGPAPNTAGPHKSDMLNKLDPRVDHDPDTYPYGRDAGTGTFDNNNSTHMQNPLSSTTDKHILSGAEKYSQTRNGLKRAARWGGDYEAGYRDALGHVEAEQPGWRFFHSR